MEVIVQNPNNITIDIDQGRSGRGIADVNLVTIGADYYLQFVFTDSTTETVGPIATVVTEVVYAEVRNAEAFTIQKGQPVYLYQAQGNLATVKLASNLGDSTSAKTLGLAAENILAGAQGLVTTQGTLDGLNTSAYAEGDTLYLGATAGTLTNVKPKAPNHLVYIGVVERSNAGAGQIYVRVQNGYELDEIHDVQINTPANGNTLIYDATTDLWKNAGITGGTSIGVVNGAGSITINAAQAIETTASPSFVGLTLSGGTANGVLYLNGSKVATSGSALTFDGGANLSTGGANAGTYNTLNVNNTSATGYSRLLFNIGSAGANGVGGIKYAPGVFFAIGTDTDSSSTPMVFNLGNGSEQMRLTSTGLGIGVSDLSVSGANAKFAVGAGTINLDDGQFLAWGGGGGRTFVAGDKATGFMRFGISGSEQMRLTSTGLGIGTSSPQKKLVVSDAGAVGMEWSPTDNPGSMRQLAYNRSTSAYVPLRIEASQHEFYIGGTERMHLDASGNLGLGVAPSAWNSDYKSMQLGINGAVYGRVATTAHVGIAANGYRNAGGTWTYLSTAVASRYDQDSGQHLWYTSTGTPAAGGPISFTQAMTLDASGNLLLGTTSSTLGRLEVVGGTGIRVNEDAAGTKVIQVRSAFAGGDPAINVSTNHALAFNTNNTERARITSGGDLLVGTQTANAKLYVSGVAATGLTARFDSANNTATPVFQLITSDTTGDSLWQQFYSDGTTLRGSIDYNRAGGLVRYNTTSDYRAKDIIGPVHNPGATIDALKVYEGVMKGATQSRPMLIAHEAQAHAPYAVSGVKDEVNEDGTPKFQQIDVSSLVPLLLAEIQSLRARVAALEQAA